MHKHLIYIGVAGDQRTTFVDFDLGEQDAQARARQLLLDHLSCDQVEVWREDHRIAVVARADFGATD